MKIIREERFVDRKNWIEGEWDNEPDLIEWRDEKTGMACLMVRARFHWCGYVGIPLNHPLFGAEYETPNVEVHGGLTFAGACHDKICHQPQLGEGEVWWFGFDCAHAGDYTGGHLAAANDIFRPNHQWETYRTVAYVQAEVTRLAGQLAIADA